MVAPQESVVHGSRATAKVAPKDLPSTDKLLRHCADLVAEYGHTLVATQARALLDGLRALAVAGELATEATRLDALAQELQERIGERLAPRMRAVINLTGTVIHTNLGRALLADAALEPLVGLMSGPNNLEFDLVSGGRGDRDSIVEGLLQELTGAEAATVVNNNAAAVLLSVSALAGGREAIVSRGELVEIGGAFRMPDVMAAAGATLVEVGTTNRTHPRDYEAAVNARTALLMKVHTSNYEVQGFTAAVSEAELAVIAKARGVPLFTDLGSGALVDLGQWGLPREPLPREMLAAGCDVVSFSGDKLLGGPQAGLIVGRRDLLHKIRQHPMKRALRMSKLPLAALEATLRLYLQPEKLTETLPTLRLLTRSLTVIESQARALAPGLQAAVGARYVVEAVPMLGQIGSGSLPVERLPSFGLTVTPANARGQGRALEALSDALRSLPRPVVARIADNRLWMDLRCLEDSALLSLQFPALQESLA